MSRLDPQDCGKYVPIPTIRRSNKISKPKGVELMGRGFKFIDLVSKVTVTTDVSKLTAGQKQLIKRIGNR